MNQVYVATGFLMHQPTRQILLHLRDSMAPLNPDRWAFFGGRAEPEDAGDPLRTWIREMAEELGIAIERSSAREVRRYVMATGLPRVVFCYPWPDRRMDFVLGEGAGFAWFDLAGALALPNLTDPTREDLDYLAHTSLFV